MNQEQLDAFPTNYLKEYYACQLPSTTQTCSNSSKVEENLYREERISPNIEECMLPKTTTLFELYYFLREGFYYDQCMCEL